MAGESAQYRMLVLLEEPLEENIENLTKEDTVDEKKEEDSMPSKSHEYIDELLLPFNVDELDLLNVWFDKFDEEICIPNEGHIKYEITSDGLIVLILDKEIDHMVAKVKEFVSEHQETD